MANDTLKYPSKYLNVNLTQIKMPVKYFDGLDKNVSRTINYKMGGRNRNGTRNGNWNDKRG